MSHELQAAVYWYNASRADFMDMFADVEFKGYREYDNLLSELYDMYFTDENGNAILYLHNRERYNEANKQYQLNKDVIHLENAIYRGKLEAVMRTKFNTTLEYVENTLQHEISVSSEVSRQQHRALWQAISQ